MNRYAKALTAAVAMLTQLLALNVIPERYQPWAISVIAALGAIGVYAVPNKPPEGEPSDPGMSEQG